jgi:hypothetical protein
MRSITLCQFHSFLTGRLLRYRCLLGAYFALMNETPLIRTGVSFLTGIGVAYKGNGLGSFLNHHAPFRALPCSFRVLFLPV